jgi:hypothetical protein
MRLTLLTFIFGAILATAIGCKREKDSSDQAKKQAWWDAKSQMVADLAKRNDGIVLDIGNSEAGKPYCKRWNIVIPVDAKRSADDLELSMCNLTQSFAISLAKWGGGSPGIVTNESAILPCAVPVEEFPGSGGYFRMEEAVLVREIVTTGPSATVRIRGEVMEQTPPKDIFYTVGNRFGKGPIMDNLEVKRILFFDIFMVKGQ